MKTKGKAKGKAKGKPAVKVMDLTVRRGERVKGGLLTEGQGGKPKMGWDIGAN